MQSTVVENAKKKLDRFNYIREENVGSITAQSCETKVWEYQRDKKRVNRDSCAVVFALDFSFSMIVTTGD